MNMINIRDSKIINNNDNKDNFNKNNNNNPQFSKKQFIQIIEKRIRKVIVDLILHFPLFRHILVFIK